MSDHHSSCLTRAAVLSDIHGNSWVLDAVLADIRKREIETLINLGDTLYGPLDPAGTAERLMELDAVHILGNQDRILISPDDTDRSSTYEQVVHDLSQECFGWIREMLPTAVFGDELFLCHGAPVSDTAYLLEDVSERGSFLRTPESILELLGSVREPVILCGHSHIPRTVYLPDGRLVVNPGSVGLPAYTDDLPVPHKMETGSPHTRYAVLTKKEKEWEIDPVFLPYPWEKAAARARENGREDWAGWLESGRT